VTGGSRRLLAFVAVVALGITGPAGHADPGPAARTETTTAGRPESPSATVTLITGDKVHVRTLANGQTAAVVQPAPRRDGTVPRFHVSTRDGQTYVVPSDVGPLLPDVLDSALFNVTGLVEQGYDDASSPTLPVILSYPKQSPRTLLDRSVPASDETEVLESVSSVAAKVDKAEIERLADAVTRLADAAARTGTEPSRLRTAQAGPLAGVEKIWLDGRVEAALDRSTGQISAPTAWDAGYDGSGVTVAVLDTGIDDTHPDLAGKVTAARNFTDDPDTRDLNGHGTHVASIIAGSGAASDGARRGVAFGAALVSGKVLNAEGEGLVSTVIAGMEWAAGEAGADIVNMSLAADPTAYGSDLVNQAVEDLTATHGTLFVVAAGNEGCDECVQSPGVAPSALTVGAVDRDDQLADFSSRGPAPKTYALKPDITAPGVGILAARAAEGRLGGEGPYLELSGTSMATPHVAGAAALLAQARPDLTPAEIKGALMSTAVPTPGLTVYEQGAGRVDLGRLTASPVLAVPGSLDFGVVERTDDSPPVRLTVTYRNVSTEPVTIDLDAQLGEDDGSSHLVTVEPARLTVPAGDTGTARVSVDVAASELGRYTGVLTARTSAGTSLRTPLGVVVEPKRYKLTVTGVARDGRPALPWVGVTAASPLVDVHTGETVTTFCPSDDPSDTICYLVPAGTYSLLSFVETQPAGAERGQYPPLHTTLVGDPEIEVTGDTAVTLDARDAVEITVRTSTQKDATLNLGGAVDLTWRRTAANGVTASDSLFNPPGAQAEERLFAQPMSPAKVGRVGMTSHWRLEAPAVAMTVPGARDIELAPTYYQMDAAATSSAEFPVVDGRLSLPVVDAGDGRPDEIARLNLRGALALIRRSDEISVADQSNAAADAGARVVAIYNDRPGRNAAFGPSSAPLRVPTVRLSHEEGRRLLDRLETRRVTVVVTGEPASPYVYDLVFAERDGIPGSLRYTVGPKDLVRVDRDFHTQSADTLAYSEASYPFQPTDEFVIAHLRPLREVPRSRTDYHLVDPQTRWSYLVTVPEKPTTWSPEFALLELLAPGVSYSRSGRTSQSWARGPLAVDLNEQFPAARYENLLILGRRSPGVQESVGMVDGEGHFSDVVTTDGDKGFTTLFRLSRGREVLWETDRLPGGERGVVELPTGEDETYRMTFDVTNDAPWAQLSTRTRTEWTFRSARTEGPEPTPLPLLTARYDLDLDLTNQLKPGLRPVEVTVDHQVDVEIPITRFRFDVSYDDGRHWTRLQAHRTGPHTWRVNLGPKAPTHARYVSLRLSATDADGNRIEQEIIRAAALRSR
jgi:subtilisin family serine protease